MDDIQLPSAKTVRMDLIDVGSGDGQQPVKLFVTPLGVAIMPKGYGDKTNPTGYGIPLAVILQDDELVVLVFGDINKEAPTHRIKLGGARESLRLRDTR